MKGGRVGKEVWCERKGGKEVGCERRSGVKEVWRYGVKGGIGFTSAGTRG